MEWSIELRILAETVLAMLLGGLVGYEREVANKPAGFRTHMLVAGAAALLVGMSDPLLQDFSEQAALGLVRSDPLRIVEAIITGISFVGAGTIFRRARTEQVEGLTTAAALLLSGAIGICVALELFLLATGITILTLVVLRGLSNIEKRAAKQRDEDKPGQESR